VNTPVLRELPVKVGVSPASVVIESDAEFDPEAETQFGNPAYARPRPSTAAVRGRGRVVAVWGPAGAPGRTTVAIGVADEAARLGVRTLLADADPYGGTVAPTVGLPDEIAGLALASRDAVAGRLGTVRLAQRSRQLRPRLRVLTGHSRADRWRELPSAGLPLVLDESRRLCALTVVDCGFCLELDEDRTEPQRNGATLAVLAAADTVLCVGAADPIGLHRLSHGLDDLRTVLPGVVPLVVANRVAGTAMSRDVTTSLRRWGDVEASARLPADPAGPTAAIRAGAPLAEVAPASPLRRSLVELARALTGAPDPAPARRRLFARR
jgi:MinD-like ATPase involved in chromosome partitioning or flagellar assembly